MFAKFETFTIRYYYSTFVDISQKTKFAKNRPTFFWQMVILLTALQPAVVRRQRGQQRALGMWLGQQLAVPSVRRRSQTAMISVCSSQDIVMSSTSIAFDTNLPV